MMRTKQVAGMLLAAGLMGSAGLAQAGGYLGGGIGSASYDYDDVDNSTAIKLYGGYTAPLAPNSFFGVEAAYVDLGEADITSLPGNWSLQMEGFSVAGLFQYVLPDGGLGFFGKIGAYSLETTLDTPYGSDSEDSAGLLWAMEQALRFHDLPEPARAERVARIMADSRTRFNHTTTARNYIALYEKMLQRPLVNGT